MKGTRSLSLDEIKDMNIEFVLRIYSSRIGKGSQMDLVGMNEVNAEAGTTFNQTY